MYFEAVFYYVKHLNLYTNPHTVKKDSSSFKVSGLV